MLANFFIQNCTNIVIVNDVIQVAPSPIIQVPSFFCHPSAQTTWIQEKEWCHPSSLPPLSSQRPYDVIPVLDTGMALLHSNRKNLVATDKIHYK
ncbi:hypothetical protein [Wolbachia endosymbiont (group A) of Beris morrisii]|uniref:hypothetical protein n=1 Tax=Wolbachia endosymbiont (group A) of Beris morrisii TaxID=3066139 RepID=UPI0033409C41